MRGRIRASMSTSVSWVATSATKHRVFTSSSWISCRSSCVFIYGPGWPAGVVAGSQLPDCDRNRFFQTVRISPAIHEPHARLFGYEIAERLFKVPLAGGFTIADGVAGIHEDGFFSPDEVPNAKNGHEMRKLIRHFIANPDEMPSSPSELAVACCVQTVRTSMLFVKLLEELGLNSHVAYLREAMAQRGIGNWRPDN